MLRSVIFVVNFELLLLVVVEIYVWEKCDLVGRESCLFNWGNFMLVIVLGLRVLCLMLFWESFIIVGNMVK